MKKRYNVNLDQVETDKLKNLLSKQGLSFSAFLNGHVRSSLSDGLLEPREGEELYLVLAGSAAVLRKRRPRLPKKSAKRLTLPES